MKVNPIGVNTFLWTTNWNNRKTASALLERIRLLGFDAVQIPILSLNSLAPDWLGKEIESNDLRCYISAGLKPERDVTSQDQETRKKGIEYLESCVEIAHRMGCSFLSGSFHSVFGMKSSQPVTEEHWMRSAESLRQVARKAGKLGMALALEPINRYESFLVNTGGQADRLIELIGESNVKVQLDTFHMNLEEESIGAAIRAAGGKLIHFHVAENHRGRFGKGAMPWDEIFQALADIGYGGAIVIESFVPEVQEVATAACIWRQMASSGDALASEGLAFLKDLAQKHGLKG